MQTGVGQRLMLRKTSYFDQTCNEFISDWVVMVCLGPKPIKVLLRTNFQDGNDKPQNAEAYAFIQRTSGKEDQVPCQVPECMEVRI